MVRPYAHAPEPVWAERRYGTVVREIAAVQKTVQQGRVDLNLLGSGVDLAWEALAWGWLLERPVDELRGHLQAAVELAQATLSPIHGRGPELADVARLVPTAMVAGDLQLAAALGRWRVPAPADPVDWPPLVVIALVRGDAPTASSANETVRRLVTSPTTPPVARESLAGLAEIADAVMHTDQAGFGSALVARNRAVVATRRTISERQDWRGVLDRDAISLALLGEYRGLVLSADVPTAPATLVQALRPREQVGERKAGGRFSRLLGRG